MNKHRKIGKFYINDNYFDDFYIGKEFLYKNKEFLSFMKNFLVIKAEHLMHMQCIEYYAYSELFDIVKDGMEIPIYDIQYKIVKNKDKDIAGSQIRVISGIKKRK